MGSLCIHNHLTADSATGPGQVYYTAGVTVLLQGQINWLARYPLTVTAGRPPLP